MYLESGLLGHMEVVYLIFIGSDILVSIVVIPFFNPSSSAQGFEFLYILIYIRILFYFDSSYVNVLEVTSHFAFDLHFSRDH